MTNKELQELLKAYHDDVEVRLCYGEDDYSFNSVNFRGGKIMLVDDYNRYFDRWLNK